MNVRSKIVTKINPKILIKDAPYFFYVNYWGQIEKIEIVGKIGHKRPEEASYNFLKDGSVVEVICKVTPKQALAFLKKIFKHKKKK